jgi:hypothetical protein
MFCDAPFHSSTRNGEQAVGEVAKRLVFFRRSRHLASSLTLIGCLLSFGCALSANADQGEPNREQNPTTNTERPSTTATGIDQGARNPSQPPTDQNQQAAHNLREFAVERLLDPVTWFTGGLLLFSWLQYRAMRRQADYMRDGLIETAKAADAAKESAAIARQTLHISQRAYLSVTGVEFGPQVHTKQTTAAFRVHNSGRMPAAISALTITLFTEEDPPPYSQPIDWMTYTAVAPPGQTINVMFPFPEAVLSVEQWKGVVAGTFSITVCGAFKYDTGFGGTGETGFGFAYDHTLKGVPENRRFSAVNVPGYNYAK